MRNELPIMALFERGLCQPVGTLRPQLPEAGEADWPALARRVAWAPGNRCLINEAFVQFAQQPATCIGGLDMLDSTDARSPQS